MFVTILYVRWGLRRLFFPTASVLSLSFLKGILISCLTQEICFVWIHMTDFLADGLRHCEAKSIGCSDNPANGNDSLIENMWSNLSLLQCFSSVCFQFFFWDGTSRILFPAQLIKHSNWKFKLGPSVYVTMEGKRCLFVKNSEGER